MAAKTRSSYAVFGRSRVTGQYESQVPGEFGTRLVGTEAFANNAFDNILIRYNSDQFSELVMKRIKIMAEEVDAIGAIPKATLRQQVIRHDLIVPQPMSRRETLAKRGVRTVVKNGQLYAVTSLTWYEGQGDDITVNTHPRRDEVIAKVTALYERLEGAQKAKGPWKMVKPEEVAKASQKAAQELETVITEVMASPDSVDGDEVELQLDESPLG